MNADRYYRALWVMFGLVAHCALMSATHWLMSDWLVASCHLLMQVGDHALSWLIVVGRGSLAVILLIGLSRLIIRLQKTRRLVDRLTASSVRPSSRLARLTAGLDLSAHVGVLETAAPLAFCAGLLCPRIYLSTGLLDALDDGELQAVLLHEDHHRRHRDPLRTLLVDVLGLSLFFLPLAKELRSLFVASAELEADRYAARRAGRPALAGALYKLLSYPLTMRFPQTVGLSGLSLAEAHYLRLAELLGDPTPPRHFSARSLLVSGVILLTGCLLASGSLT
jgi:Zn-dependent protease with chaperone function